jgi:exopolyphosphatase/guanosine-5'-triphosphate,3'-diphosphate pyrophosphatase
MSDRRLAVIDLGSNSFRLVVFTWGKRARHGWWRRTDEIYEAVRVGAGLDAAGELQAEPMERAIETIELFAHFCRATEIDDVRPVATSAIRDATNRKDFLRQARKRSGLEIEVLSPEDEARYGYLAAVNSTTLSDGVALDLGGGSMQLTHVRERHALDARSWPLGAVRMTERFLTGESVKKKQLKALRAHIADELASAGWLAEAGADGAHLAGIGGAELAADKPSFGVQGFLLERKALDELVDRFADMSPEERGQVPGIKPERGDLILAGAFVIQNVMDIGAFDALEVTEAGLREGVFYSTLLEGRDPPLFEDVRREAVCNLAAQYGADFAHVEHVARLALGMWDALGEAGVHPADPRERDLLWAAAMVHDIGTAVDYDDHHKHSRYLILNAGLPGHTTRETALIGQIARYHRKGNPSLGLAGALARDGDEAAVVRCSALLRLGEQFERSRDQVVHEAHVSVDDGHVDIRLEADEDVSVARWAAERQRDLFERAFGKALTVSA